ncbi:hypothetical protein EJ110_NYTH01077 [Nymphaea thermarum]|nr:hypothetical protein EJ110_NYTH01077 [Nymphaea thermarum]
MSEQRGSQPANHMWDTPTKADPDLTLTLTLLPFRLVGVTKCFHSGSMGSIKNKDSKMSDMNAKMKTAAIVSMEKAKAAAVFGAQKVSH